MRFLVPVSRVARWSVRGFCLLLMAQCLVGHTESRRIEKRVAPVYPELARRMRISGVVRVAATVSADGSVTEVKGKSGNPLLIGAAEQAVRKWKFEQAEGNSSEVVQLNFVILD